MYAGSSADSDGPSVAFSMGKQEQLQRLFEKLSDAYEDVVEQKDLTADYVDLQFLRNGVEIGRVRLSVVHVDVDPTGNKECRDMVRVVDHYGGEEVIVSEVVSAVIAVCTR